MKKVVVIILLVIALIFVCLGIGAVIFFTANGGFPTNNPFDRRNIPSVLEESKTLKVDAEKPLTLKVADDAGAITITGADVDTVQVKVVKTAYDSSQSRADEEVKGIEYTIEQTGNSITLKYELPKSMNFNNNVNTVDFIVTVPHETTVDVDTSMGEVSVTGTKGSVDARNDFGDVTIENVEGAVTASSNSGTITARSINAGDADISLHSGFGSISLENVNGRNIDTGSNSGKIELTEVSATGDLTSKTDFGDTTFENGSAASLNVETNSGSVSLVKINIGEEIIVKNDFGNIDLNQASAASYDLHTNSGAISVDGEKGKLKASTDFGNIKIKNAENAILDLITKSGTVEFSGSLGQGPHIAKSDFGNIDLSLPADSKLTVDLSTGFGKIKSDLPITVTTNGSSDSDRDQIVGSINGGGEQLTVQTNSGAINIRIIK